jgi:hypothetical protein
VGGAARPVRSGRRGEVVVGQHEVAGLVELRGTASGLTGDEWMAGQEHALEAIVADGRHPNFAGVLRGMEFDLDLDQLFEFGLQRLLDGIAARPAR